MRRAIAASAALALTACATMQTYQFDNSRTYAAGEPAVWDSLMDYFTTNNVQIKTIERDSGIIYCEQIIALPEDIERVADCAVGILDVPTAGTASFNVFVRSDPDAAATTTVTVNTEFVMGINQLGSMQSRYCVSKGALEAAVLDHVSMNASR